MKIPTLEAVYREFPDRPINIELKEERPGTEEAIWRVVEAAGGQARTLVVTDSAASIKRFRAASAGTVATGASIGEFVIFKLLSLLRLGRLYDAPFQALQPPDSYKGIPITTRGLVREAHRCGLRVDVWTVDEEADMRRLLDWGVDGIMTDPTSWPACSATADWAGRPRPRHGPDTRHSPNSNREQPFWVRFGSYLNCL